MRACSRATATVDLPDPESPVSQRVQPACPRTFARSLWEISLVCQVIFSDFGSGTGCSSGFGWVGVLLDEDMTYGLFDPGNCGAESIAGSILRPFLVHDRGFLLEGLDSIADSVHRW